MSARLTKVHSRPTFYRLKVIAACLRKRNWSARELADKIETSTKTIHRDVELLRNLGLNISGMNGSLGFIMEADGHHDCPLCSSPFNRSKDFQIRTKHGFLTEHKFNMGVGSDGKTLEPKSRWEVK